MHTSMNGPRVWTQGGLVFITTDGTASASELVINSLILRL